MNRRSFLATGATLAVGVTGGCTGCARMPTARLSMEPVSDEEIAERATRSADLEPPSSRYRFASRVVENGPVTVEDTEPPFPADSPFVLDGGVYRLSVDIVDSVSATRYRFTLDPADGDDSTEGRTKHAETIRYGELPPVDRKKFESDGLDDPDHLGVSAGMVYTDDEQSESVLVPEPEYDVVVWDDGTRGRWRVDGSAPTSLQTYRYDSAVVHESAAEYGASLREEYAFELSGISDAERDVASTAIEDAYVVAPDESPPDAFWTLAERFGRHAEFPRPSSGGTPDRETTDDTPVSGTYVVLYDGTAYWTRVRAPARETTETNG